MSDGRLFDEAVGGQPTWSVAELNAHIARVAASAFPSDLWVEGQIRNLSRSAAGHVYFDLVEPTEAGETPRAQVSVILRSPERRHVNRQLTRAGGAVRMADGIEVRMQGRLRWYGPRGSLQLQMSAIDPAFTLGRLQADRDRILAGLAEQGLLAANGRMPLPLVPLRIGLVTSRGTAAHADVMAELEASGIGFEVHLADARTQGADCGPSVVRALTRLAHGVTGRSRPLDVVLLVRGGGARTDLAGFDTEVVARAVAAMPVPVLTGIGHEVDRSIADEVAHTSHKTPTAAAAAVVSAVRAFTAAVDDRWTAASKAAVAAVDSAEGRLQRRSVRAGRAAVRTLDRHQARIDATMTRTGRGATRVVRQAGALVTDHQGTLAVRGRRQTETAARSVESLAARARAHDPSLALARGWTITTTADGLLVRDPAALEPGTVLVTRFADATVHSAVESVEAVDQTKGAADGRVQNAPAPEESAPAEESAP